MRSLMMAVALAGAVPAVAEDGGFDRERGRLFASIDVDNGGAVAAVLSKAAYRSMFTTPDEGAAIVTALMQTSTGTPRCQKEAAAAVADAGIAVSDAQLVQAAQACPELVEKLWRNASTPGVLEAMSVIEAQLLDRDYDAGASVIELLRGAVRSRCSDQRDCRDADAANDIDARARLKRLPARRAQVEQLPGKTIVDKLHQGLAAQTVAPALASEVIAQLTDKELASLEARARTSLMAWCASDAPSSSTFGATIVSWTSVFSAFDTRCAGLAKPMRSCSKRLSPTVVSQTCVAEHDAFEARQLKQMKPADAVGIVEPRLVHESFHAIARVKVLMPYLNRTSARVTGIVVAITVKNPFGRDAYGGSAEDLVVIEPGDTRISDGAFVFVDNPFKPDEPYDRLWQLADADTARVSVTVKKVVFDNGVVLGR